MTPHQILIVGIRLLVIFWLLSVLGQAGAILTTVENMGVTSTPFVISVGLQFVAIVVLWLFPATLATKLLRSGNVPVQASTVAFDEWRDLVFVGVGIFVLARALPNVIYWAILAAAPANALPDFTFEQKANAFSTVVELAIGLTLTLGATGLSSLIQKGRRAGLSAQQRAGD
ncbi:hypothetical protein ACFPN2_18605 [Steroidobacter flavus]|uniref:DUF2975 domain-containing protein n=1 Tax=Steroidobacter flavus TaxID=1842136 RepID=A0ABV8SWJ3_9GAMM